MNILKFIRLIRDSHPDMVNIYTNGSCLWFYRILKQVFPHAECYIDIIEGHIITKIDGKFYDITGEVEGDFTPFTCEEYRHSLWGVSKELLKLD